MIPVYFAFGSELLKELADRDAVVEDMEARVSKHLTPPKVSMLEDKGVKSSGTFEIVISGFTYEHSGLEQLFVAGCGRRHHHI